MGFWRRLRLSHRSGGLKTNQSVLQRLALTQLIAVQPDLSIGLTSECVVVRQDCNSPTIAQKDEVVDYVSSRKEKVIVGLSEGVVPCSVNI